jgi:hypothetical protein
VELCLHSPYTPMDRGKFSLFAKGRQRATNAQGFTGHRYVGRCSSQQCVASFISVTTDAGVYLVLLKGFMLCVQITAYSTSRVTAERERSGGNFVIYSHHTRAVTALSLRISEPTIAREMGSQHSISDIPFKWVDKE